MAFAASAPTERGAPQGRCVLAQRPGLARGKRRLASTEITRSTGSRHGTANTVPAPIEVGILRLHHAESATREHFIEALRRAARAGGF